MAQPDQRSGRGAMRWLVITPYFPPALGGACRMLGGVADALAAEGDAVDVLTFGAPLYENFEDYDAASGANVSRVPAHEQTLRTIAAMARRLATLLRRNRYDLVFCGVAYSCGVLAYLAHSMRRVPYVIYSHGEDVTVVEASGWKGRVLKRSLRNAAHVFANSAFTRDALLRAGAPPERVEILYPSIEPEPYLRATDERAKQFLQSIGLEHSGTNLLLTVARLQERKGHDIVIRALPAIAQEVPDVHYLIVGIGDAARLTELARSLDVGSRVTMVNSLGEDALADAYRAATVYVMVSRTDETREVEGFGMAYLEAGAAGRPSVSGDQGGAPEAVVDGLTGLVVDATSAKDTADALISLLIDSHRRDAMGRAARARVIDKFSDQFFFDRITTVCREQAGR